MVLLSSFQTINTVSEVIRGSQINQDYFASVNAPSNPPRSGLCTALLGSSFGDLSRLLDTTLSHVIHSCVCLRNRK